MVTPVINVTGGGGLSQGRTPKYLAARSANSLAIKVDWSLWGHFLSGADAMAPVSGRSKQSSQPQGAEVYSNRQPLSEIPSAFIVGARNQCLFPGPVGWQKERCAAESTNSTGHNSPLQNQDNRESLFDAFSTVILLPYSSRSTSPSLLGAHQPVHSWPCRISSRTQPPTPIQHSTSGKFGNGKESVRSCYRSPVRCRIGSHRILHPFRPQSKDHPALQHDSGHGLGSARAISWSCCPLKSFLCTAHLYLPRAWLPNFSPFRLVIVRIFTSTGSPKAISF